MILPLHGKSPDTARALYISHSADLIGEVILGRNVTVWFNVTIRGDLAPITIGEGSNIQDNAVVHMNSGIPVSIGKFVSIAHGAIVHGCTILDRSLIGMGAIVMDEAVIGESSLVAAGSLVPPGKTYPPGSLILGSPAKAVRRLTDEELARIDETAEHYMERGHTYLKAFHPGNRSDTPEA